MSDLDKKSCLNIKVEKLFEEGANYGKIDSKVQVNNINVHGRSR